jgi:hypothetical protein
MRDGRDFHVSWWSPRKKGGRLIKLTSVINGEANDWRRESINIVDADVAQMSSAEANINIGESSQVGLDAPALIVFARQPWSQK